ncbi:MAG: hypothetical protein KGZ69_12230 [Methylomonas sp.]|nr:hypothetical protein [Methylomonas sp.]
MLSEKEISRVIEKARKILIILLVVSESSFGVDIEQGIRNLTRYQAWMSIEVRVPSTGMFIASRAVTEDKRKNATLAFTMSPNNGHCQESMEVIFDVGSVLSENQNKEGLIEIQVDSSSPLHLSGKIAASAGDHYLFFEVESQNLVKELFKGKELLINVRGIGLANFSLAGFSKAWKNANNTCKGFDS